MMLFFIYLIDNSEHRGNLQKNDKCGFTHLLWVGLYFQKEWTWWTFNSFNLPGDTCIRPIHPIYLYNYSISCVIHLSRVRALPKSTLQIWWTFSRAGHRDCGRGSGVRIMFLAALLQSFHPTYARDLTIGWTGEKWRVGSKQMVALYKTAGRDVQMLSFEGAASTTPTYLPSDFLGPFHNLGDLTPPSWGWCVRHRFWGQGWNNGTRQSHYMTWPTVFVIYLGVPSFYPLVGWVWSAEQDGDGGQAQQDAKGDDEQALDKWDRGWGCGEDQSGRKKRL